MKHDPRDPAVTPLSGGFNRPPNRSEPVGQTPDLKPVCAPAAALPEFPSDLKSFADVDRFIACHPEWTETDRGPARSTCRGVAARIHAIRAAERNEPFEPDPKKLDLASVPFDIAMINAAWKNRSYRAAGFDNAKSFRNARWTIRNVGRRAGMVIPDVTPPIVPGDPFELLQQSANKYDQATARRFTAWCQQTGLRREDVTDATLIAYRAYVMAHMIGRWPDEVIRLVARLWNSAARRDPAWPQTRLSAPTLREYYSLPFTAYPVSFQDDVAALAVWMAGTRRRRAPHRRPGRKRPMRPATIKNILSWIRLATSALVAGGRDPASITELSCLVTEADMEAILLWHEERGKAKHQGVLPEAERVGTNVLTQSIATTLVMIAQHHCAVPPQTLTALKELALDFRVESLRKPTLKNRHRISVLLNDRAKLKRLMRLPRTLMDEALARRDRSADALREAGQANGDEADRLTHSAAVLARQAAYLAREAALIGILCRIPLRIKNLHEIQIGTNLQFAGGGSDIVTLNFTIDETKNRRDLEFYIGPRLHALLQTYIAYFLPVFAAGSPDLGDKRWLFPSGGGRPGPLSIGRVRAIITRSVEENVGVTVHPHLFRALAVTLALEHSPGALEHCRQLLGDQSLKIVQRHYAMTQEKDAARRQSAFVDAEEDRLAEVPPPASKPRKGRRP
jgi:integrase